MDKINALKKLNKATNGLSSISSKLATVSTCVLVVQNIVETKQVKNGILDPAAAVDNFSKTSNSIVGFVTTYCVSKVLSKGLSTWIKKAEAEATIKENSYDPEEDEEIRDTDLEDEEDQEDEGKSTTE